MKFHRKKSLNEMGICCASEKVQMSVHMHHQIGLVPVPASGTGAVIAVSLLSLSLTFMLKDGCLGNSLDRSVNVRWVFNRYWFFWNFHCLSPSHLSFVTPMVSSSALRSLQPTNPTQRWQEKPQQELQRVKGWQWPSTNNTVNTLRSAGWLRQSVTGGVNEKPY